MAIQDKELGFYRERIPQSERVIELRKKYGLPENASLAEVEPVATGLLANRNTMIEGVELVLGRRVRVEEFTLDDKISLLPLVPRIGNGQGRFAILLMQSSLEDIATSLP